MENGQAFAHMLNEGIYAIQRQESVERRKPIGEIQEELGSSINRQSSTIAYYLRGHTPNTLAEVEQLAKEIVRRGGMDRAWVEKFLRDGGHTNPKKLSDELFSTEPERSETAYAPRVAAQPGTLRVSESKTQYADVRELATFDERLVGRNSVADDLLVHYFTDAVVLRTAFKDLLAAPTLPKRLFVIHGVGGVGKTSLLRIFRLYAKSQRIPVGLVSANEAKSPVDVLATWMRDLRDDAVELPGFLDTYNRYRTIQKAVSEQSQIDSGVPAQLLTLGFERTGSQPATRTPHNLVPAITGSSHVSADAIQSWLRQFLMAPDIDLWLDPVQKLTTEFLNDLSRVAKGRRMALLLDTYEQMTAYDDWFRMLAHEMPESILVVIAGRISPNWGRSWAGWTAHADVREVKAMEEPEMRNLVSQYYQVVHGVKVDSHHVEAIVRFARGLPIVVTSAIDLCVRYSYSVTDFEAVKPQVTSDLVDRLIEGVPQELLPVLEVAAVLRWFNREMLRYMFDSDVSRVYDELRHFPFVRPRAEGLALHDTVREMIDEYLRIHDPRRHRELHERAAKYFEAVLAEEQPERAEYLELERLYHRIQADEDVGIVLFQSIAITLLQSRLANRLEVIVNDVNNYPLRHRENKLWREYFRARLIDLRGKWQDALDVFQRISDSTDAGAKLRSYALCWIGQILSRRRLSVLPGGDEKALAKARESLLIAPEIDETIVLNYLTQSDIYVQKNEWEQAIGYLEEIRRFHDKRGDHYGQALACRMIQSLAGVQGDWPTMFSAQSQGLSILPAKYRRLSLYGELKSNWTPAQAYGGRYWDAEKNGREGLALAEERGEVDLRPLLRDLAVVLVMQNKFQEAEQIFQRLEQLQDSLNKEGLRNTTGGRAEIEQSTALRFRAVAWLKEGKLDAAKTYLAQVLEIYERTSYFAPRGEAMSWLGLVHELDSQLAEAAHWYQQSLSYRGRRYFDCGALTGLARVKAAQSDQQGFELFAAEAEQLAGQYEYSDHLASLYLTKAYVNWQSFDVAADHFRCALIYALRYNRFLLDEVLSGRPEGSPLQPIIPYCLRHGSEGLQMLNTIREWWLSGSNDRGIARPSTISRIPEGISLLEGERIARTLEPGDGTPQRTVIQQIEAALR